MTNQELLGRSALAGFIPTVIIIVLFGAYVAYSSSQVVPLTTNNSSFTVGSVQFGGVWSYGGNVTLSGSQSTCEVLGVPCPESPSNTAMEFRYGVSTSYVEFANLNDVELTVVLINGEPYCVSPKLFTHPGCPAEIGTGNFPSTTQESNSSLGLEVALTLNSTSIQSGQPISINVAEYNFLDSVNNVSTDNDWAISGLTLGGCGTLNYPMGIAIFKGNYDQGNFSSLETQTPLSFYQPGGYSCPAIFLVKNYQFEALSNTAMLGIGPGLANASGAVDTFGPLAMTSEVTVSGFWTVGNILGTGAAYHNFGTGTYTIIAGDEWGDVTLQQFTVS